MFYKPILDYLELYLTDLIIFVNIDIVWAIHCDCNKLELIQKYTGSHSFKIIVYLVIQFNVLFPLLNLIWSRTESLLIFLKNQCIHDTRTQNPPMIL